MTRERCHWPIALSLAAVLLAAAGPARAHHSGAGVDRSRTVTVTGIVKDFRWTNPHSWIDMEVTDAKGTALWSVEMNPPPFLIRAGWKSTTLKPGDKVSVTLNPIRTGEPGGIFVSVTLADGRVLGGRAGGAPAAPATPPAPSASPRP
jgi:hypothetical protein